MLVYEKPVGRVTWLLGFIDLRELLRKYNVNADELKGAMTQLLQEYSLLPETDRLHFRSAHYTRREKKPTIFKPTTKIVFPLYKVAKNGGILLVNPLQSSRSTFSRGSLISFFAFKEGMLGTPMLVLGG
jgi:hypothetical protein